MEEREPQETLEEIAAPDEKPPKSKLEIQQRVYDMILYAYPALDQFPKSQKFSLAQDIKKSLDSILRLVIAANKKYTKKTTLQELDIEIAALKVYIRMATDLKYLSFKKTTIGRGCSSRSGKWSAAGYARSGKRKSPRKLKRRLCSARSARRRYPRRHTNIQSNTSVGLCVTNAKRDTENEKHRERVRASFARRLLDVPGRGGRVRAQPQ